MGACGCPAHGSLEDWMESTVLHIAHASLDNLAIFFPLKQIRKPQAHSSLAGQWWQSR